MAHHHNKDRALLRANTYTTKQAMADVRAKLLSTFSGTLATICRDDHPLAGYPVCSVVPFVLDAQFRPVVQIAIVAEHTHNARANPKASLFLRAREAEDDVQSHWRIGAIGDLRPVPEEELPAISEHYYAHYPQARHFDQMHDFFFFRLEVQKYRVIMGFGDIRWVAGYAVFEPCPFVAELPEMLAHMNGDHQAAMQTYLARVGRLGEGDIVMTHLNQYGFVLRQQQQLTFIPFENPPSNALEVRKALVAMARG